MLTQKELSFTESFLAGLKLYGGAQGRFPIGTDAFDQAVDRITDDLDARNDPGLIFKYELDTLFSRVPVSGCYERFIDALCYLNGRYISLENPRFIKATISMSEQEANRILGDKDPELRDLVKRSVECFVAGSAHASA